VGDVSDADLHRDLEQLREAYRRKLPGRLAELDALLNGARQGQAREPLEAARRLAHMMKGTAGSYGFDEISAELGRIEESLEVLLAGTSPDSAVVWNAIEQAWTRVGDRLDAP
jgi:HPt (histidine-containing phosphotransfer) domain-containing protein